MKRRNFLWSFAVAPAALQVPSEATPTVGDEKYQEAEELYISSQAVRMVYGDWMDEEDSLFLSLDTDLMRKNDEDRDSTRGYLARVDGVPLGAIRDRYRPQVEEYARVHGPRLRYEFDEKYLPVLNPRGVTQVSHTWMVEV